MHADIPSNQKSVQLNVNLSNALRWISRVCPNQPLWKVVSSVPLWTVMFFVFESHVRLQQPHRLRMGPHWRGKQLRQKRTSLCGHLMVQMKSWVVGAPHCAHGGPSASALWPNGRYRLLTLADTAFPLTSILTTLLMVPILLSKRKVCQIYWRLLRKLSSLTFSKFAFWFKHSRCSHCR